MVRNKIKVELNDDALKILKSMMYKKRQVIIFENLGILDVSKNEIISEVINDILLKYGIDYLSYLQNECDELRKKNGYRAVYNKDRVKEILGFGDRK